MPTTNTTTIQATGGSPDYTTIAAWEAATDNDLVTADTVEIGQIISNENYNESVTIAGATTDATRYRKLTVHDDNWHKGTYATTGIAHMLGNPSGRFIFVDEDYFMVERMLFSHVGQSPDNSDECIRVEFDAVGVVTSRCIARGDGSTDDCDGFYVNGGASGTGSWSIDNCLVYDFARAAITAQFYNSAHDSSTYTINVDHVTADNIGESGEDLGGGIAVQGHSGAASTVNINAYNNVVTGTSATGPDCYEDSQAGGLTVNWTGTHNATDDGSLTTVGMATNAQENLTRADIFTAPDSDDYTPAASEALEDNGTNRQDSEPDSRQDFSTDITGATRGTTGVEIGCYAIASGSEHTLLADDAESASEVTSPSIGQEHALLAADAESASEVTTPAVGQVHALLADDTESASETSSPAVGQTHALLADDAESASEVTAPAVGQTHVLLADDAESASETSSPVLGQEHVLLADDVESASEVSAPTVGTDGTHALLADDVESASEVTSPTVGQVHALLADDVESASETSAPTASESNVLLAEDVESASEVSAPAVGQAHVLLADDAESASETSAPTIAQVHVLFADDAESASEVTSPAIGEPITDTAPTAARRVILVSEPRLVTVAAESRIVILAAAADRAVMLAA